WGHSAVAIDTAGCPPHAATSARRPDPNLRPRSISCRCAVTGSQAETLAARNLISTRYPHRFDGTFAYMSAEPGVGIELAVVEPLVSSSVVRKPTVRGGVPPDLPRSLFVQRGAADDQDAGHWGGSRLARIFETSGDDR